MKISEPITLDGILDEAVWSQADVSSDFTQREPDTGQPATQRTEIRVVYTPKTLYISVLAFDTEAHKLIAKEMQRDAPLYRDDSVIIVLDTFDDDRNAYLFETNALGARTDGLITDEGRNFNLQWDGVWDVGAQQTADGWSAELAIPFSTLRFDPEAEAWGLNVRRYIRRRAESTWWSPILLDATFSRVSLYGDLTGIRHVEPGWNLNVKPFVVGTVASGNEAAGNEDDETDFDYGLDTKWGITRGLSLDLTWNTDFGETEVDAQQVNLTRFSLFFEEKRDFFLENTGIFEFGPGATGGGSPLLKVFHSRRIGIGPGGDEVPIEWGARLTGRVGEWNIGILDVQTGSVVSDAGGPSVPSNNWGAVRVTRNFGKRSNFGMIFTQRDENENNNRVYGLDLDFKPTERWGFDAYLVESETSGLTDTTGWSAGAGTTWDGQTVDWRLGWVQVGEDFDPQMGFKLRRNRFVRRYNTSLSWDPRLDSAKIMNLHFKADAQVFTDIEGDVESQLFAVDLFGLRTAVGDEIHLFGENAYERLSAPFEIAPGVIIPADEYNFNTAGVRFLTHSMRPVSVSGNVRVGDFYDGDRLGGAVSLLLRPNRYIRSETTWEYNDIKLPGGEFTANIVRERLAFAISPRILSNLFIQYNDLAEVLSVNLRFNWIYRPGADLFVVYNQSWDAPGLSELSKRDRQFIVKFTCLFQK